MPIVAPSKPHFCRITRSWSSGYDRRLPSDGPGFNSRRTQSFLPTFLTLASPGSVGQVHPPPSQFAAEDNPALVLPRPAARGSTNCTQSIPCSTIPSQKKRNPRNRSRTSDLEISIVAIYSLPLCQLSYTRTYGSAAAASHK